jgi:2-polyprenyl-6-methoxyphenol hydroxylase-like FAD-dependent oxidoreductase
MHVLIAGGGIAGLALAARLEQAGVGFSVHEQAPELHEVGAGIGLWPNALQALHRLGLATEVIRTGGGGADSGLRTSDGR